MRSPEEIDHVEFEVSWPPSARLQLPPITRCFVFRPKKLRSQSKNEQARVAIEFGGCNVRGQESIFERILSNWINFDRLERRRVEIWRSNFHGISSYRPLTCQRDLYARAAQAQPRPGASTLAPRKTLKTKAEVTMPWTQFVPCYLCTPSCIYCITEQFSDRHNVCELSFNSSKCRGLREVEVHHDSRHHDARI